MKENCYALRPGTILGYRGAAWRVISHDTLVRRFTISRINANETKTISYQPGQEIDIRWKPDTRI